MHLLAAQAGAIQQEGEAIDLGQSRGDIVFASAADSELSLLAAATDRAGFDGLRLANLLRLSHHLSVDLWLENTVRHARLAVVRLLGGAAYWQYGVDELSALAAAAGLQLALLPGDATPDPILRDRSTIAPRDWDRLFALLVTGGAESADAALAAMRDLALGKPVSPTIGDGKPMSRFGLWRPPPDPFGGGGEPHAPLPVVPMLFYRALLDGAGTAVIEALAEALVAEGLAPLPIFVSSLKESEAVAFVQQHFAARPPAVILNLTGFALGLDGLGAAQNPFAGTDAPVIQLVQGGRPEALWANDKQGLTPKDLAMQVVMPELDGRIGMLLVGHKADAVWHARTQCPLSAFAADSEGIARAAGLAGNWARLRRTPRAERRIGIVLANYPIRDGRLANGVGYDAPQSTVEILQALGGAGYELGQGPPVPGEAIDSLPPEGRDAGRQGGGCWPQSSAELIALLQAGPTNAHPARDGGIPLPLARYRQLFAKLPAKIRAEVTGRWGAPEADPFVRQGAFHLPALRFGNIAILLQPARGYGRDVAASYHDPRSRAAARLSCGLSLVAARVRRPRAAA